MSFSSIESIYTIYCFITTICYTKGSARFGVDLRVKKCVWDCVGTNHFPHSPILPRARDSSHPNPFPGPKQPLDTRWIRAIMRLKPQWYFREPLLVRWLLIRISSKPGWIFQVFTLARLVVFLAAHTCEAHHISGGKPGGISELPYLRGLCFVERASNVIVT